MEPPLSESLEMFLFLLIEFWLLLICSFGSPKNRMRWGGSIRKSTLTLIDLFTCMKREIRFFFFFAGNEIAWSRNMLQTLYFCSKRGWGMEYYQNLATDYNGAVWLECQPSLFKILVSDIYMNWIKHRNGYIEAAAISSFGATTNITKLFCLD